MKSPRLTYRPLEDRDATRIALYAGDWDVARMSARIPFPYSEPLARAWMETLDDDEFVRIIELDGELIGAVGYVPATDGSAEIGYWIGRPWWGRGYATEAAEALVRHCFRVERIGRLTCCHFIDNDASARVIAKLGFRPMGPSTAWCDARRAEVATLNYERHRSVVREFWRRAALR